MTTTAPESSHIPPQIIHDVMLSLGMRPEHLYRQLVHQAVAPGRFQIGWRRNLQRCVEYVQTGDALYDQLELRAVGPMLVEIARQ
jgi:hypothetical protein